MINKPAINLEMDEKNRARALDFASFIVEAPAGAGKADYLLIKVSYSLSDNKRPNSRGLQ